MPVSPPICDFGWKAPAFTLTSTHGDQISLSEVAGEKGTLVMFICNHCPYVIGILDRLVSTAEQLEAMGVSVVAICSNDATTHPADSFEKMGEFAKANGFPFPYLHDEDQSVARAYDAICTPDFFGFNADLELQYRGRLDSAGKKPADDTTVPELLEAMRLIAETGKGPEEQTPSMGCSIKWKEAA
ncbi:MAG: thioredoxin family protein [Mangrovicoccus sp.]